MIIASRRGCVSVISLVNRFFCARSHFHMGSLRPTLLLEPKFIQPNLHAHQRGVCVAEFQRRHSSSSNPGAQRYTKHEVAVVRDAHAARKSAGEILELLDGRNHLGRLTTKPSGLVAPRENMLNRRHSPFQASGLQPNWSC